MKNRYLLTILVVYLLSIFGFTPNAFAAITDDDIRAVQYGAEFYQQGCNPNDSQGASNKKVVLIGDSILNGGFNDIKTGLESAGYEVTSDQDWAAQDGRTVSQGIQVVKDHSDQVKEAGTVVIELGTNSGISEGDPKAMMDEIANTESDAKVYWVTPFRDDNGDNINDLQSSVDILKDKKNTFNFNIIDWAATVASTPGILRDNAHPKPDQYITFNTLIVDSITKDRGTASECTCGTGIGTLTGSNNAMKVYNYFSGREISGKTINAVQAAGIVGNFIIESGVNVDPKAVAEGGGPGAPYRGIAQWDSDVRWPRLESFARDNGNLDPWALETQVAFVVWELENTHKEALNNLVEQKTARDAGISWNLFYEIGAGDAARGEAAETFYNSAGEPTNNQGAQCNNGLGVSPDGFVFPLKTTKSIMRQGNGEGAIWPCATQPTCTSGHPYNAADLFAPTGTEVYPAISGEVASSDGSGCRSNCSVSIKGDDNNYYLYTHMGSGTIPASVTKGTGADAINTATGRGTTPHLHFDIRSDQSASCTRANPNSPGCKLFLDPIPALKASYNNLPEG